MKIPITSIIVADRQRKDLGDIQTLADSFVENGQLSPILVVPAGDKYNLVAGGRRCAAAALLNWQFIEGLDRVTIDDKIVLVKDLTPLQLQVLEYEENVRRKDITWKEACVTVAKLHLLKQLEHGFATQGKPAGDAWSEAKMADFTGYNKSQVHYMLAIAKELQVEPPSAIHECKNYSEAFAFLAKRTEAELNREIELRRQRNNPPLIVDESAPPSAALDLSHTEGTIERTTVRLHGIPRAFGDCVPDVDFMPEADHCILAFNPDNADIDNVVKSLRPNGYAILWNGPTGDITKLHKMPGAIMWYHVAGHADDQSPWPFTQNYMLARVYTPTLPTVPCAHHYGAVVSCIPDHPTDLPSAVVDYSIAPFALDGMAVTVFGDVNPVHVAELGRVPIFYEPDQAKFELKCKALKQFYEENIPGVEVIV